MRAMSTRRRITGVAAGLLVAATFLGTTAPAFAAVGQAAVKNEALPAAYGAGQDVGFRASFTNTDTSTYSKVYLTLATTGAGATTYLASTRNGADNTKDCTKASPVTCTFKTVKPGEVIVVTAAYAVPSTTTSLTGQGIWSTSGQTTSDGGTSHGDSWIGDAATSTKTDNAVDVGGGFSTLIGTTVGNGQTVTALNRQATKVTGLPVGVAATVADDTATGDHACGPYDCSNAIGTWSDVTVGDGQTFGSAFQIVITYYQGTPKSFVHQYSDGAGGFSYELVGACPKKVAANALPCFTWSAKLNQATINTLHNGSWRGL